MDKQRALFLCTGNSCRSQIAEAITNAGFGDHWEAFSAGSQPAGFVHPLAIKVLAEIGITHQGFSKPMTYFRGQSFDLIVTVCADDAENCPVWLGSGKKLHIGFPDPAKVSGSEDAKIAAFRKVRDDMLLKITSTLESFQPNLA